MGKLLLFSAILCTAVATIMCAATSVNDKKLVLKREFKGSFTPRMQGPYNNMAMEQQYDNKLADEEQYDNKLAMEEQYPWMAKEEQHDNQIAMEEQVYNNQIVKEEQYPLIAEEEQFARMELAQRGVAYVRWGRTTCPAGAELVYAGRAAGSHFTHSGGGSNYQCVTLTPENFNFGPGTVTASYIYGSEYEMFENVPHSSLKLHQHDVPCAVCYVTTRTAKIMIPGTYKCPANWNREYYGYLMAERYSHHRSTFECMDKEPEKAKGGHANHNGALFYHVEPRCGSLPCPPYDEQKEMTCAVCTR